MSIHDNTQLLTKEASVELLADMLRQAEADKRELLKELRGVVRETADFENMTDAAARAPFWRRLPGQR